MSLVHSPNDITINGPSLTDYVDTTSTQTIGGNKTFTGTLTAAAIAASNGITGTYQTVSSNTTLTRSVFGGAVPLATPQIQTTYTVTLPH